MNEPDAWWLCPCAKSVGIDLVILVITVLRALEEIRLHAPLMRRDLGIGRQPSAQECTRHSYRQDEECKRLADTELWDQ